MSTGVVFMRPFSVVSVRVAGSYGEASVEAWRQMYAWFDTCGMRREIRCGYGLMRDAAANVPAGNSRYDACVELPATFDGKVQPGFRLIRIAGGSYARRRLVGGAGVPEAMLAFRDGWVEPQGLAVDPERPFIEVRLDDPVRVAEARRKIELCIPVMRAASRRSAA